MSELATLIKFGHFEHLCELRNKGLLYLNNLPYFWKIEDEELRGDINDSIIEMQRGKRGTLTSTTIGGEPIKIQNWFFRVLPTEPENINIFCMCAVRHSTGAFPIDSKNFRFGEFALVFTDPQEFIDRIALYMKKQKIKSQANLVEYIDNDYKGEVGPFRKLETFVYQSEWRFVCYNGPGKERIFHIGNIENICTIMKSTDVNLFLSEYFAISS